jgi:hypothetical protein
MFPSCAGCIWVKGESEAAPVPFILDIKRHMDVP